MTLSAGFLLNNRYRILSILGQGGMGAIYHAVDENLGISVAVKENLFLTDEYARQFQREANILASLHHPNLPRVRDYFSNSQGQYMVMDYIEGEDLRARIDRVKYLPEKEALLIAIGICEALNYMHSREPAVVHRDVKPGNIRITPEGNVVLVDFGLAKVMQGNQVTTTGARAMTPGYSPPEQYGTGRTDARTDIYSLGATLYAALTGVIPEDGLERATGKSELTPLRTFQPRVNRRIAAVVEKSLEVEPEKRYQTAEEFREALIDAAELYSARQKRPTVPPPPSTPPFEGEEAEEESALPISRPPSRKKLRIKRTRWITLTLALIVLGVVLIITLNPSLLMNPAPTLQPTGQPTRTASLVPTASLPAAAPTGTVPPENPATSPAVTPPKPSATVSTIKPTPVGGSEQIAFASNRTGSMQIWLMNVDGSQLEQLTRLPNGACQPEWSPDGLQIAFISPCLNKSDSGYPGGRIFIMDADGSNIQALPVPLNPEGDYDPAWSPDGKRIAYTSLISAKQQILVYSFEDKVSVNVSSSRYNDYSPTWSPSGKMLAFVRQSLGAQIFVMGDRGENPSQFNLSEANLFSQHPAFTPDGQYILYSQYKANAAIPYFLGMRIQDQGSTKEIRIPPSGASIGPVSNPTVSPDGFWIVFESWPDGKNHDIYRMLINGGDRAQLTSDPGFDFGPVWRPVTQNQ